MTAVISFMIVLSCLFIVGDVSAAESVQNITINLHTADWTPPQTTLSIQTDSTLFPAGKELIVNPNFLDGLQGWQVQGEVAVGNEGVTIGSAESDGLLEEQSVSQTILGPIQTVHIRFRGHTKETLEGFDDPALQVRVNGTVLFQKNAASFTGGWEDVTLPLWQEGAGPITVQILAGNTGDNENASWVDLREVSTQKNTFSDESSIKISAEDQIDTQTFMQVGDTVYPFPSFSPLTSFENNAWNFLSVWSVNTDAAAETPIHYSLWFDSAKPVFRLEDAVCFDSVCRARTLCPEDEWGVWVLVPTTLALTERKDAICKSVHYFKNAADELRAYTLTGYETKTMFNPELE